MPLKDGDRVSLTCEGRRVAAQVVMVSPNQKSLAVEFEAILAGHVGMMPLMRDGDSGPYHSFINGVEVIVEPANHGQTSD
jgi:hypothetical protein